MFEHELFDYEELDVVYLEGLRFYKTPSGKLLKSVTTRLSEQLDKSGLEEWKLRVGIEEAKKIASRAASKGLAVHSLCQNYLLNIPNFLKGVMPFNLDLFRKIQPILDKNIGKVYGIECPLYSYNLMTAGRADCIAEFDGLKSIIDFKTSIKIKKEQWIDGYFIQATCYALMLEELKKIEIPQIIIIISVDHEPAQVFIKSKDLYVKQTKELFINA